MRLEEQWLLSDPELAERKQRTREFVAATDVRGMRRELRWWKEFRAALAYMLQSEVEYHLAHPEEYFVPLDEVPYFAHWTAQQIEADSVIEGIRGAMRYIYERG